MTKLTRCPRCRGPIEVTPGATIQCPGCGAKLTARPVPEPVLDLAPFEQPAIPPPESEPITQPPELQPIEEPAQQRRGGKRRKKKASPGQPVPWLLI
ncbi:MAG: hypothetical protein ACRC33_27955, partial [Gemmataceae bacterium]